MKLSLLYIRTRAAAPLVWLLAFALLVPASPHLTKSLVLCVAEGHVDVEAAGPSHHEGIAASNTDVSAWQDARGATNRFSEAQPGRARFFQGELSQSELSQSELSQSERQAPACADIPLSLSRANDPCHQAVVGAGSGEDVPLPQLARHLHPHVAASIGNFSAASPSSPARVSKKGEASALAPSSSPRLSGTVVLLI